MGCGSGEHAPGLRLDPDSLETCWKHFRQAHALAVDAIHEVDGANLVGLASTGDIYYPETECAEDVEAARQLTFAADRGPYSFSYALALDHLCGKEDFIGLNVYHGTAARMGAHGPERVPYPVGGPRTAMGWTITPESLEWGPRFVTERYHLPVYISENGLSCQDKVFLDGKVHDPQRIDFLTRYLRALSRAIAAGADVRGYFQWSLIDNFEWAEGYNQRFGLVYVDYQTGARIPKDSAEWYKGIAASNGAILG